MADPAYLSQQAPAVQAALQTARGLDHLWARLTTSGHIADRLPPASDPGGLVARNFWLWSSSGATTSSLTAAAAEDSQAGALDRALQKTIAEQQGAVKVSTWGTSWAPAHNPVARMNPQ